MSKRKPADWQPDDRVALAEPAVAQLASVQWEYLIHYWSLVLSDPADPGKEIRLCGEGMDVMGADGWECFSTIGGTTGVRCFFKRPRPDSGCSHHEDMSAPVDDAQGPRR